VYYAMLVKNLVHCGCDTVCKCVVVGMCLVEVVCSGCVVECELCGRCYLAVMSVVGTEY
jgi:hypothetical protein